MQCVADQGCGEQDTGERRLMGERNVDVARVRATHRATYSTGPEPQPIALSLSAGAKYGVLSRSVELSEVMAALP